MADETLMKPTHYSELQILPILHQAGLVIRNSVGLSNLGAKLRTFGVMIADDI